MNGIETKIEQASRLADDNEENNAIIRSWSEQAESIRIAEEFLRFPETIRLRDIALSEVKSINQRLLTDKKLTEQERLALMYARDVHNVYLNVLNRDPKNDTKALETEIDNSIRNARG